MTPRRRLRTRLASAIAIAALLAPLPGAALPGWAEEPARVASVAIDVAIMRPVGLVPLAVGAVLFVPAAWLTAFGGRDTVEEAWERFVLPNGQYVFSRPLGEF